MPNHRRHAIILRHVGLSIATLLLCSCDSGGSAAGAKNAGGAGQTHGSGAGGRGATQGHSGTGGHTAVSGHSGGSGGATGGANAGGEDGGGVASAIDGGTALLDSGSDGAGDDPASQHCLDGITDYTAPGPFEFDSVVSNKVNMWIPRVTKGCKLPIVHFSNGTGAACPAYAGILEHLASHGFLTACYEDPSPDDGTRCMTALQAVLDEHADLADGKRIGSTGQEVGGGVALACLYQAEQQWGAKRRYAGHAIAPVFGATSSMGDWMTNLAHIESPVFMFNGSEDFLVSAQSVRAGYELVQSEKYWYEATGALHIPVPESWARESAVVFFRWKLLGDEAAGDYFAHMPDTDRWDLQEQSPAP